MDTKHTESIRRRYNRIAKIYDLMDGMLSDDYRRQAIGLASGKVLEIGVGTGRNLPFYPADCEVIGIDFSPKMLEKSGHKIAKLELTIKLLEMDVQALEFPDDFFDTVVGTCVFCSVPDPIAGLKEIKRVTKPEGQVILLEHIRSERPALGLLMDAINPLFVRVAGANINRRTLDNIKQAGLEIIELKDINGPIFKLIQAVP